jgi:ankyrin repeat protein
MQELASIRTRNELIAALESTSESLDDFYRRKMRRIKELPQDGRDLANKALAWLAFAERPLKGPELQHALGVEEGSSKMDAEKVPGIGEIVALCEGFVTYGEMDGIFGLVHASVSDYLQNNLYDWGPDPRATIATGCITYLAFDTFREGFSESDEDLESRLRDFPLYRYAAQHWGNHLRDISSPPGNEILSFLMDQSKVASASQAMQVSEDTSLRQDYSQQVTTQVTGLHLAALFGLKSVIKMLLAEGHKLASEDSEGRTPLWRATEGNHEEAMKLICSVDRTTFELMLARGEKILAASLLQAAGQNIKNFQLRTALHIGVLYNDSDIMDRALRCGVDINSKDGNGNTPIQLAFQETEIEAINWLLDKSAATADITTDDWLRVYRRDESDIVELSEEKSGSKKVRFLTQGQFEQEIASYPEKRKRLL